VFAKFVSPDS